MLTRRRTVSRAQVPLSLRPARSTHLAHAIWRHHHLTHATLPPSPSPFAVPPCTLTLTLRRATCQTWAFSGLLALGIFEYQATILSYDFLQEALPQLAMFEKIELLHRLYPIYLIGARMVHARL
jgi:hypothetical protein